MPSSWDDDDDEVNDSDGCEHCSCWPDGGDCCDCGAENDSYEDDADEVWLPTEAVGLSFDDDGSEEIKDEVPS